MNRFKSLRLAVLTLVVCLALLTGFVKADATVKTIDAVFSSSPSMVINSAGNPVLAYASDSGLKFMVCDDPACVSRNAILLTGTSTDRAPALVLTDDDLPRIVYHDRASSVLRLIVCMNTTCSSVGIANLSSIPYSSGAATPTAIALQSSGNVLAAYEDTSHNLRLVSCDDASCTTSTDTIVEAAPVFPTAIDLYAAPNPVIAYVSASQSAAKLAVCGDVTCTTPTITTLDSADNSGRQIGLALSGFPIIGYVNAANQASVISCTNASCTTRNTTIMDSTVNATGVSLAVFEGRPALSYTNTSFGSTSLEFAICTDAACSGVTHKTIEGQPGRSVGIASDLEVALNGFPVMTYQDNTNIVLRLAICSSITCESQQVTLQFDAAAASASEGAGLGTVLKVTTSDGAVTASPVAVTVSVMGGTATTQDYALTGTILVPAGTANNALVSIAGGVTITDDALLEPDETVSLALSSPVGAILGTQTTLTHTIEDDDTATVSITANDSAAAEPADHGQMTVTLSQVNITGAPIIVDYNVTGDAVGGTDYTTLPGSVSIADGESQATIDIAPLDDAAVESFETVTVTVTETSDPRITAAASPNDAATVIITDEDTAVVTIADVSFVEGNAGPSLMTFTATLNNAVQDGFTVDTGIADGTATTANNDYSFTPSTLIFIGTVGETKTFTVTINGDGDIEPDETFTVSLNTVSHPAIDVTDIATGTIQDDDKTSVMISDVSLTEGNAGTSLMTFTATLNNAVQGGFTVNTGIADGTATTANGDYSFTPSTLTFAGTSGETKTFTVTINGDAMVEPDETFTVSLNTISNAQVLITDTATGTITNDDTAAVTIADVSLIEGNAGTSLMTLTATLNNAVQEGFTVNTGIADGTATVANADYSFTSSTLTFAGTSGETKTFTVTIDGDAIVEPNETFTVSLYTVSNAQVVITDTATGTITNDDTAAVTIADVSLIEGNAGTSLMTFTAMLNNAVQGGFTVNTGVANGTAVGGDYSFTPSTLTFAGTSGETKTFTVTINGDAIVESNETFTVSLNTVSNTQVIITDTATGTIIDDETTSVTIADVSLTEGNAGTSLMTFTATLSVAVQGGFTVKTGVADGTATVANGDYSFVSSTLTFAGTSGETKTFTVTINGDTVTEPDETFIVSLNTISNAQVIITDTATGTITNDDTGGEVPFFTWDALPSLANTTLSYELQVAKASTFAPTSLVLNQTTSQTSFAGLSGAAFTEGVKYWRVRGKYTSTVTGLVVYTPYTATRMFTIDTVDPTVPTLTAPIPNGLITNTRTPTFTWTRSTGAVRYRVEFNYDLNFSDVDLSFDGLTTLTFKLPNAYAFSDTKVAWRVVAIDVAGNEAVSAFRILTIDLP